MRPFVGVLGLVLIGCNGNGHVEQRPFVAQPGDDVVSCACNLTFDNEHCSGGTCYEHFSLPLCLPPALQQPAGAPPSSGGGADGGSSDYARAIDEYCRDTITNTVYHLIKVFNGGWCDYKAPFAPDGGVGQSVICFAQPFDGKKTATASDDGTCRTPCPAVECDYATNCGQGVQDSFGNPDLDKCKCSQIVSEGTCPGDSPSDLPTPLFCRPPKGDHFQ